MKNYLSSIAAACLLCASAYAQSPPNAVTLGESIPPNARMTQPEAPPQGGSALARVAPTYPVSVTPANGSADIAANAGVSVTFSGPIDPLTVTPSTFILRGALSGAHTGTYSFSAGNTVLQFVPSQPFTAGEMVTLSVTDGILDVNGFDVLPWASKYLVATSTSSGQFIVGNQFFISNAPFCSRICDLNLDGKPDVLGSINGLYGPSQNKIAVIMNLGSGMFGPVNYADIGYSATNCGDAFGFDVADLNGDGYPDIAATRNGAPSCSYASVIFGNGSGGFGAPTLYPVNGAPDQLSTADFDGDGDIDLAVSGGGVAWLGTPNVSVLLNNGNGSFAAPIEYFSGSHVFGVTHIDLDADGDQDLISANSLAQNITVSFNDGYGVFSYGATYATGALPRDVAAHDLNGDGYPDIVVANQGSPSAPTSITRYFNNGNGTLSGRSDFNTNGLPVGMDIGDVDGDGDVDVVVANHYGGSQFSFQSVSIFRNINNTGNFIRRDINAAGFQPIDVALGDLNGDGSMEIVTSNLGNQNMSVLYNQKPSITGTVYVDLDEDCSHNLPSEDPIAMKMVKATDMAGNEFFTYSDGAGEYAFILPPNQTYTVEMAKAEAVEQACNGGNGLTYTHTILAGDATKTGNDFFLKSLCSGTLGAITVIPQACSFPACVHGPNRTLCPCETYSYQITVTNTGNSAIPSGSIFTATLPPDVKLCSNSVISNCAAGIAQTGGTLRTDSVCTGCTLPDIYGGNVHITLGSAIIGGASCQITLQLQTANVTANCRNLNVTVALTNWNGNPACATAIPPVTNSDPLCCSYDPNDKKVYPNDGICAAFPVSDPLLYTVRFQNTGTAPAAVVEIRDQIDSDLNIESFQVVATSHPLTDLEILPGNIVSWLFEGIYLPDSSSDPAGSIGYIQYRVKPKTNVIPGAVIENHADIYFDANAPVVTNTTVNMVDGDDEQPANFTIEHYNDCDPRVGANAYIFTYTGGLSQADFLWTFGPDANISTATWSQPFIIFANSGQKTVTLTVTTPDGCSTTKTETFHASGMVEICHIAPTNNRPPLLHLPQWQYTTISVPMNAALQHLSHGDYCGPCHEGKTSTPPTVAPAADEWELFPNPAQSDVHLHYHLKQTEAVEIALLDQMGREIRTLFQHAESSEGEFDFNISDLPAGVYFVTLRSASGNSVKKLLVVPSMR